MTTKVLVLGNFRQTLTVLKSLARRRLDVVLGRDEPRVFTQYSRYASELWDHPKCEEQHKLTEALAAFLSVRPDISLVFPVGEAALEAIALNFDSIARFATVVMPDPRTALTCLNKQRTYDIVSMLDIPLPVSRPIHNTSELTCSAAKIGFPCVVKPNDSLHFFFKQKAVICRERQDIERTITAWPEGNEILILQKYVNGNRWNCHFAARHGRMVSYFEQVVVRTDRADGTGYGVEGLSMSPSPQLITHCARIIAHLEYSGVGCIQFLRDKDSEKFYFLEMNPRLDATCAIPYHCGVDFPRLAVDIALGRQEPEPVAQSGRAYLVSKRGYWLNGDIEGLLRSFKNGSIDLGGAIAWTASILKGLTRADLHLTFSWKDPIPALFLGISPILSLWRSLRNELVRNGLHSPVSLSRQAMNRSEPADTVDSSRIRYR